MTAIKKDLFVLTADLDAYKTIESLLNNRVNSIHIRTISHEVKKYSKKDPGCYRESHEFLRTFQKEFNHALVVFDHEGSGVEDQAPEALERKVEDNLYTTGWNPNNVACIVIQPELESWVWQDSIHVANVMGWSNYTELQKWLNESQGFEWENSKPLRPKEAMRSALEEKLRSQSSAYFASLASDVTLTHCRDRAFNKLMNTLKKWFPV